MQAASQSKWKNAKQDVGGSFRRPAFSIEKALEIINDGSGKMFDPKVVEAFMDALPEIKVVLKKYQES